MSGSEQDVERAKVEALRARAQLADTMGEILNRLHPRTLISEVIEDVRERGHELADQVVHAARARPVATSAMVAAVVALFAREPIWKAVATLIFHRRETGKADEVLKDRNDPPPPTGGELPHRYEEVA
jgi:hypothetical protein